MVIVDRAQELVLNCWTVIVKRGNDAGRYGL